ncbi:MAG: hypothetical protein [Vetruanivirus porcinprimi]|uniref:CYTH domain-containing protein n=1 Tax=phage Lak_Megaphage_RVC_AP1_GC26 TaxID=3109224 RepID=A0ABZ0Z5J2_9CAUD|nr:MAG: hypothetical protein [phage Lak_Megaphage_RVC_AP1_GC26]
MIDKYINVDKVISIKIFDKKDVINENFVCTLIHRKGTVKRRRLKFNGFKVEIECVYYKDDIFEQLFSGKITRTKLNELYMKEYIEDNIENNYIIEDNILYEKPRIEITLINDELEIIHRDSVKELYKYLDNIGLSKHKNIKKV